jgi:hypothetical protein
MSAMSCRSGQGAGGGAAREGIGAGSAARVGRGGSRQRRALARPCAPGACHAGGTGLACASASEVSPQTRRGMLRRLISSAQDECGGAEALVIRSTPNVPSYRRKPVPMAEMGPGFRREDKRGRNEYEDIAPHITSHPLVTTILTPPETQTNAATKLSLAQNLTHSPQIYVPKQSWWMPRVVGRTRTGR